MAIKKSDLYSSLWASCDELRGGMDASQYKDYVLFMLFIKYISDKYADSDDFAPPVVIPKGASFQDMVALKGKGDIGDKINTQIIQPLIDANARLARSDFPDFNDPNKLGQGKEMVDRLTNLVAIFQKPELDFSDNRAEHDDILGDAYEYLMRHFATESGKSKGQFYTPSEVSRVIAKVIGIGPQNTKASTTAYDPTCGSGSLLLKVAAEAGNKITLEGQEKDVTTAGLARMNMILHDFPTANIQSGNTLSSPKFLDGQQLRTYDYVVANPPFSDKAWSTGLSLGDEGKGDPFQRFTWGLPPAKQGDFAYLLHIVRSMKASGKAACILPHGVLFRGNAEAVIRKQLVTSGFLKGIIGLPANLFYGTGIPACILVLDKENATARKGVMMIDASKGYIKDGNKNRLREQDIHRIVDTFLKGEDIPRYARMVPLDEMASDKNDFNLNLPRYIDSSEPEDLHDITAHLRGGIPARDLDDPASPLAPYWQVLPGVRSGFFESAGHAGYLQLKLPLPELKAAIGGHAEFQAFNAKATQRFAGWRAAATQRLQAFGAGGHPKALIEVLAEELLAAFADVPLIDAYDVYQHLMDYWAATMQDDAYLISAGGWVAKTSRILETDKKGKTKDRGWTCELIPKPLIVARYFAKEQKALDVLQAELDAAVASQTELEEEQGDDEGVFAGYDSITVVAVKERFREIGSNPDGADELKLLKQWLDLGTDNDAYAAAIFETMNDRGKPLSPVDMLKAYLLAPIEDTQARSQINQTWKQQVLELISWGGSHEPERDANCIKAWLRAQYAETTRERKAGAVDKDWELIGSVFHRWVRDHSVQLGLGKAQANQKLMAESFPFFAKAYRRVLHASKHYTPGLEAVYYNAHNDFTWQSTVLLAPLAETDDDETVRRKMAVTATYLDIWLMRRAVNYIRVGYSSVSYAMWLLCRDIRRKSLAELVLILQQKLADDEVTFAGSVAKGRTGIQGLGLNQFSRRYIYHLLARITEATEAGAGRTESFDKLVNREVKNPFDIEHIWADDFEAVKTLFATEAEFVEWRNHVASLLLLPADVNRSLQAKPFDQKRAHYAKQNFYAASLDGSAYQHQPQFQQFAAAHQLPFQAFKSFTKAEQQTRRLLVAQLVELVWSPSRLQKAAA